MVDGKLVEMLHIMVQQQRLLADLRLVSRQKTQVLLAGEREGLDMLIRGEQALVWQFGQLEDRRFRLQFEAASELSLEPSELTLTKVVELAASMEGTDWAVLAKDLREDFADLNATNELNMELIQQAMAYTDFALQAFQASCRPAGRVYSPAGTPTGSRGASDSRPHRIDNRA